MREDDVYTLPEGLPVPADDGAASHLCGMRMPSVELATTLGRELDVSALGRDGRAVLYVYPRTGRPDEPMPQGWNQIPGARGCTPQACAFRDHHRELLDLGAEVFGLSTQTTADQREFAQRVHLPYELLSDAELELARGLRLPSFAVEGRVLLKRLTLIVRAGAIEQVFYPVFPPDRSAADVVRWLRMHPAS